MYIYVYICIHIYTYVCIHIQGILNREYSPKGKTHQSKMCLYTHTYPFLTDLHTCVCVCVCVYIYTCRCMNTYSRIHDTGETSRVFVGVYACIYVYVYTHTHIYIYIYIYMHIHDYIYVCMYICMYTYTHM